MSNWQQRIAEAMAARVESASAIADVVDRLSATMAARGFEVVDRGLGRRRRHLPRGDHGHFLPAPDRTEQARRTVPCRLCANGQITDLTIEEIRAHHSHNGLAPQ